MTALITLPLAAPVCRPNTRELLPLDQYDLCLVSFSGGKDSLSLVLDLLDRGVSRDRIQLWHQDVDGEPGVDPPFMDWSCTRGYVRAVGLALGIRTLFQFRRGGFEGELLKQNARTRSVVFERQDGSLAEVGGLKGKIGTRRRFPQVSSDLRVRWCSPLLKIDVAAIALNNEPAFKKGKRLLFLTGERREEGRNGQGRALYAEQEPHRCDRRCRRVDAWRSVIEWPEARVWDAMRRWRIRPHPAYRLRFPRVSCQTCIFGGPDQWASVRKIAPDRFARILSYERLFGSTIKQGLDVEQVADRGTPYPECNDKTLVGLALSHDYPADQVLVPSEEGWQLPAGAFKRGGGPS